MCPFNFRAPSPIKRKEEEKTKDRGKEKTATKEVVDKDRGREKGRKRRNASTGSSRCLNFQEHLIVNLTCTI